MTLCIVMCQPPLPYLLTQQLLSAANRQLWETPSHVRVESGSERWCLKVEEHIVCCGKCYFVSVLICNILCKFVRVFEWESLENSH